MAKSKKAKARHPRALVPETPKPPVPSWEHEFERLFDRITEDFRRITWPSLWGGERMLPRLPALRMPAVDVYEEKDAVVVKAELPGMAKDDIEVNVTDRTLTIKGEKKKEEEVKEHDYYRSERSYGAVSRTLELPAEVKVEGADATFKDGVLHVRLPKSETARRKKVEVKVD